MKPPHGCLVTGTDTGVGKTIVSAAIVAALRAGGVDAIGLKPVVTGTDEAPPPPWPADHELLAAVSGAAVSEVNFLSYAPPVSPHLAAQLTGRPVAVEALLEGIARAASRHDTVIVEGVGGLLVPLDDDSDVADLARALGLPLILVARPGLGTINHTLLTLEAARRRGLTVAGVVLTPWPARPDPMLLSNRETIARLGEVAVATVGELDGPEPDLLAHAGAGLPLSEWLGRPLDRTVLAPDRLADPASDRSRL